MSGLFKLRKDLTITISKKLTGKQTSYAEF